MKYCSNCGKELKTIVDFDRTIIGNFKKGIKLSKKCFYCGATLDVAYIEEKSNR